MYMTGPELWAKSHRSHGEGNKEIRLCADDDRVRESELNPRDRLHLWQGDWNLLSLMLMLSLVLMLRLIFDRELRIFDGLLWLLVVSVDVDVDLRQGAWNPWSSTMAACRPRFSHGRCGDHEELLVAVEKWTGIDKTTKAKPFLYQNTSAIFFVKLSKFC